VPSAATLCGIGSYCVGGEAVDCPEGHYCGTNGLIESPAGTITATYVTSYANLDAEMITTPSPTGACAEGHWCPVQAITPVPSSPALTVHGPGGLCPAGYWCGSGTKPQLPDGPTACAAGTFGAGEGLRLETDCSTCPDGFVCPTTALTDFDEWGGVIVDDASLLDENTGSYTAHPCPAGKHCPAGLAADGDATDCDPGFYCPEGSLEQLPCEEGTYQPDAAQDACLPCDPGQVCPYNQVSGTSS
jgi:hypothetical protein